MTAKEPRLHRIFCPICSESVEVEVMWKYEIDLSTVQSTEPSPAQISEYPKFRKIEHDDHEFYVGLDYHNIIEEIPEDTVYTISNTASAILALIGGSIAYSFFMVDFAIPVAEYIFGGLTEVEILGPFLIALGNLIALIGWIGTIVVIYWYLREP